MIAAGDNNSMAFSDSSEAYGWGNNSYLKLGINSNTDTKLSEIETGTNYFTPTAFNFYLDVPPNI